MMQPWPSAPHSQLSPWGTVSQPLQLPQRTTKRRHEPEEEDRDERMDRSPTPTERPKRAAPKRARIVPTVATAEKGQEAVKESKSSSSSDESDVDVGFLLGEL